jgi:hypothetical protein
MKTSGLTPPSIPPLPSISERASRRSEATPDVGAVRSIRAGLAGYQPERDVRTVAFSPSQPIPPLDRLPRSTLASEMPIVGNANEGYAEVWTGRMDGKRFAYLVTRNTSYPLAEVTQQDIDAAKRWVAEYGSDTIGRARDDWFNSSAKDKAPLYAAARELLSDAGLRGRIFPEGHVRIELPSSIGRDGKDSNAQMLAIASSLGFQPERDDPTTAVDESRIVLLPKNETGGSALFAMYNTGGADSMVGQATLQGANPRFVYRDGSVMLQLQKTLDGGEHVRSNHRLFDGEPGRAFVLGFQRAEKDNFWANAYAAGQGLLLLGAARALPRYVANSLRGEPTRMVQVVPGSKGLFGTAQQVRRMVGEANQNARTPVGRLPAAQERTPAQTPAQTTVAGNANGAGRGTGVPRDSAQRLEQNALGGIPVGQTTNPVSPQEVQGAPLAAPATEGASRSSAAEGEVGRRVSRDELLRGDFPGRSRLVDALLGLDGSAVFLQDRLDKMKAGETIPVPGLGVDVRVTRSVDTRQGFVAIVSVDDGQGGRVAYAPDYLRGSRRLDLPPGLQTGRVRSLHSQGQVVMSNTAPVVSSKTPHALSSLSPPGLQSQYAAESVLAMQQPGEPNAQGGSQRQPAPIEKSSSVIQELARDVHRKWSTYNKQRDYAVAIYDALSAYQQEQGYDYFARLARFNATAQPVRGHRADVGRWPDDVDFRSRLADFEPTLLQRWLNEPIRNNSGKVVYENFESFVNSARGQRLLSAAQLAWPPADALLALADLGQARSQTRAAAWHKQIPKQVSQFLDVVSYANADGSPLRGHAQRGYRFEPPSDRRIDEIFEGKPMRRSGVTALSEYVPADEKQAPDRSEDSSNMRRFMRGDEGSVRLFADRFTRVLPPEKAKAYGVVLTSVPSSTPGTQSGVDLLLNELKARGYRVQRLLVNPFARQTVQESGNHGLGRHIGHIMLRKPPAPDKIYVLIDDLVASGNSMAWAAQAMQQNGAREVFPLALGLNTRQHDALHTASKRFKQLNWEYKSAAFPFRALTTSAQALQQWFERAMRIHELAREVAIEIRDDYMNDHTKAIMGDFPAVARRYEDGSAVTALTQDEALALRLWLEHGGDDQRAAQASGGVYATADSISPRVSAAGKRLGLSPMNRLRQYFGLPSARELGMSTFEDQPHIEQRLQEQGYEALPRAQAAAVREFLASHDAGNALPDSDAVRSAAQAATKKLGFKGWRDFLQWHDQERADRLR